MEPKLPTGTTAEGLQQVMNLYCDLMAEIKIRETALSGMFASGGLAQVIYESSYLQLRMICELIALACLVVHGDIEATKTKKMKKTWEADKIVNRLSELHPDFYPHPVRANPQNKFEIGAFEGDYLSKEDLIMLYRKCGDRLHRGTLFNVRHRFDPANVPFVQVIKWRGKIVHLLQHHWIKLHGSGNQIGVQMQGLNQRPSWNYWAVI